MSTTTTDGGVIWRRYHDGKIVIARADETPQEALARCESSVESRATKSTHAPGDYVKVEFPDKTTGIGEWVWVRVSRCDEQKQLVFGTLDSEPLNDYDGNAGVESELAVSFFKIREHRKPTEFAKQCVPLQSAYKVSHCSEKPLWPRLQVGNPRVAGFGGKTRQLSPDSRMSDRGIHAFNTPMAASRREVKLPYRELNIACPHCRAPLTIGTADAEDSPKPLYLPEVWQGVRHQERCPEETRWRTQEAEKGNMNKGDNASPIDHLPDGQILAVPTTHVQEFAKVSKKAL